MCNSRRVASWLWAKTGEGHRALRFPSKCFLLLNSKAANKPPSQLMLDVTCNASGGCRGSVLFYLTRFCLRSGQAFLARLAPWMWGFGQCQQGAVRLNCLVGSAAFNQRSKPGCRMSPALGVNFSSVQTCLTPRLLPQKSLVVFRKPVQNNFPSTFPTSSKC